MGEGDPPDPQKASGPVFLTHSQVKTLNSPGPKYIVISRADENEKQFKLSPFAVKKIIDHNCGGEVDSCKRLRSGDLLIKTKNLQQANKLLKMTHFTDNMPVIATEHLSLNYSKGVIYSNDLRDIPENEIQSELESQNVTLVKKIMKKINGNLCETGLHILTFASTTLPNHIMIGYEKTNARQYIPTPLRCNNCFRFGHTFKVCKNEKTCFNCGSQHHVNEEENESCTNSIGCINCSVNKLPSNSHSSIDKKCPIYLKQQEIIAIKTTHKVDNKTAYEMYSQNHQLGLQTFANVTKMSTPDTNLTKMTPTDNATKMPQPVSKSKSTTILSANNTARNIFSYEDIEDLTAITQPSTSLSAKLSQNLITKSQVQVLPRTASKKALRQLKSKAKSNNIKTIVGTEDSSDTMEYQ